MDDIVLGEREGLSGRRPFGLSAESRRQHLYVIGKTGTGKTTLLRNLLIQDIEAGRGCGLIDPHGDLAEELLDHIPRRRTDDVVYLDPADLACPPAFNLLESVPPDARHLVTRGVVAAMRHIWHDSWGARLDYILTNAVAALLDYPSGAGGQTLLGISRMLIDPTYRARVTRYIVNPKVRQFWEIEFPGYTERYAAEATPAIENKIGQLLTSPTLRNILGQVRSTIRPAEIMDKGQIFIANLAKGRLGEEDASLLGSLLVTSFQLAVMARAAQPEEARRDFFLVIDEFQNFGTRAFASILSEARKYRLGLTIAHQYTAQLDEAVRASVFGNVGSLAAFRVGADDTDSLARELAPYPAKTLRELDRGQIAARLLSSAGEVGDAFLGTTLPPLPARHGRSANVRAQSRCRYGRRREVVEDKILRWLQGREGNYQ